MTLSYAEALTLLDQFEDAHLTQSLSDHSEQVWSLAAITSFMAALGDPHLAYPTIHVAGSKGKGSTCVFIASALTAAGRLTGLYTTPPLSDFRESIQVNGQWIAPSDLASLIEETCPVALTIPGLTRYEFETGLAFLYFARQRCDYAVIEVGMGGRLDATNIVQPVITVITPIGLEHTAFLGDTLPAIAAEKAGIIKPGVPLVLSPQQPEALEVLLARASALSAPVSLAARDYSGYYLSGDLEGGSIRFRHAGISETIAIGLPGLFQADNAAAALMALILLSESGIALDAAALRAGIAAARLPGRLERIPGEPAIVLDGAHTPASIDRLAESIRLLLPSASPLVFIFGCLRDKDSRAMLATLLPLADTIIFTRAASPRAASPFDLLGIAADLLQGEQIAATYGKIPGLFVNEDVAGALQRARAATSADGMIVVTGSLALVGVVRSLCLP